MSALSPGFCSLLDTIDCIAKQLSEAFVAEAMEEELLREEARHQGQKSKEAFVVEESSKEETSSEEASQGSTSWTEERNKQAPSITSVATAAKPAHFGNVLCSSGELLFSSAAWRGSRKSRLPE